LPLFGAAGGWKTMEKTTAWDRMGRSFELILAESANASDRLAASFASLGNVARTRVEKARLERALFKTFAAIGARVYMSSKRLPDGTQTQVLDETVETLLREAESLDADLQKVEAELSTPATERRCAT
jgi:hypothetical protein